MTPEFEQVLEDKAQGFVGDWTGDPDSNQEQWRALCDLLHDVAEQVWRERERD